MDIPKEFLSKEFLSQFKTGEDVTAFMKELHTRVYEQMLEAELDNHLGYEKHSNQGDHSGNSCNGSYKKQIQTEMGESVIQVPRDRKSEFEPVVVPKHQSRGLSIERLVISLYAKGMSVSDIESEMQEIYGINLSTSAISIITNKVSQAASEWQNRPLESLYMIVWMDGIVFKVRENGKVINKTVYLCVGLNKEGLKEVLGMWVGKNESAAFWMGVLTDLKATLKDFEVLAGPFRSTQQKTYMIEGQNKQDESIIYTYILQANKVGTFVIPPATITANGSLITSNSVQIKVQFAPPTVTSENVRDDKEENVADNSIYETVEQMPEYPSGGTAGLMNFISKNLKYPTICQESGVQGRVVVSFVVNKDGSTTDFRIIRSVDKYLDKEALRVLNGMPKWKPGKQKGVPVRVRYTVPINFKLS